jgi:hypothetical protein
MLQAERSRVRVLLVNYYKIVTITIKLKYRSAIHQCVFAYTEMNSQVCLPLSDAPFITQPSVGVNIERLPTLSIVCVDELYNICACGMINIREIPFDSGKCMK